MTRVKICGNTNLEDVRHAIECGADFIGFIFAPSKRKIDPLIAASIVKAFPNYEHFVGVFVNEPKKTVETIARDVNLQWLQFHGDETSRYCKYFTDKAFHVIKSFRVKDRLSLKRLDEYNVDAFLFDAYNKDSYGGSGKTFDWSIIENRSYVHDKLFLAGGLSAQNIEKAIRDIKPYAVDLASGVEREPGKKDPALIKELLNIVKRSENRIKPAHKP